MIQRYPSYLKGPLSFASVVNITASLVEFDLFSTEGKVMVCKTLRQLEYNFFH